MRRLLIVLALLISVIANAQIQTKFWGLELAKCYGSLDEAREIISQRCKHSMIQDNQIVALDGNLGGYNWNYATFSFLDNTLYSVSFVSYYKTFEDAVDKTAHLEVDLTRKYGKSYKAEGTLTYYWADEDFTNKCYLDLSEGMSNGGEKLWYITLNYWNKSLNENATQQIKDEL